MASSRRQRQFDGRRATHMSTSANQATETSPHVSPLLEQDARVLPSDASIDAPTTLSVDVIDLDEKLRDPNQECGAQMTGVEISGGDSAHVSVLTLVLEKPRQEPPPDLQRQPTATGSSQKTQHVVKTLEPNQCTYRNGQCKKPRTLKNNGALHSLCDQHRRRSLDNQKRFDQKQRVRRLCEQLQLHPDAVDPASADFVMTPQCYLISDQVNSAVEQMTMAQFRIRQDMTQDASIAASEQAQEAQEELIDQEDRPTKRMKVYIV